MRQKRCEGWRGPSALAALLPAAAFAAADNAQLPRNLSPWGMFMGADIVVKAVIVGLAFASLVTWTVWLAKTIELRRQASLARRRVRLLESDTTLSEVEQASDGASDAVAQIIQSAARETKLSRGIVDDGLKERIALRLERVEAAMSQRIARGTGVLATIGATAPFVGLFGTVWGIMNSFIGISEAQTTNLAVVAPGIAEALLATALGLVAAIPAVVIYNHLARSITAYRMLLTDASAQVLLLVSRQRETAPSRSRARRSRAMGARLGNATLGKRAAADDLAEVHEINVTPFIDVMLVLLIIFMVAAPLATVDLNVELPASAIEPQPRPDKPVFVTVKPDLSVAVGEDVIARDALAATLDAATKGRKDERIFLRADKAVSYGELMEVMNALRNAGYLKIALVGLDGRS